MGLFDVDEDKIKALYHRAWLECNRGFVAPRKYPYLYKTLFMFARENIRPLIKVIHIIWLPLGRLRVIIAPEVIMQA